MNARFLVIGLGQFGAAVAESLVARGVDVTAVDARDDRVDALSSALGNVFVLDATDETALQELRIESFDAVINCIGDESLESSILTTALLRQVGARRIIARATTRLHARILKTIGADEIVQPESQVAHQLALQLASPALVNVFDFGGGTKVAEVKVPEEWVGKTLVDLDLRRKFEVNVVGLRRKGESGREQIDPSPPASAALTRGDALLVMGKEKQLTRFLGEI